MLLSADKQKATIKQLDPDNEVRPFLNDFLKWARLYTVHPEDNAWVNGILAALLKHEDPKAYRGADSLKRRNKRPFWLWARLLNSPRAAGVVCRLSVAQHNALDKRFLEWSESKPTVIHDGSLLSLFSDRMHDNEVIEHIARWLFQQPETQFQPPENPNDRNPEHPAA